MAFTIRDFHDLIGILEQHPERRTDLRRLVLTEELLSLPQIGRDLAEAQQRTEQRVEALAEAQRPPPRAGPERPPHPPGPGVTRVDGAAVG